MMGSWTHLVMGTLWPKGSWSGCCKVTEILESIRVNINNDDTLRQILLQDCVKNSMIHTIEDVRCSWHIWKKENGNCFLRRILAFYFDVFKDDSNPLSWLHNDDSESICLVSKIPVEILVVADSLGADVSSQVEKKIVLDNIDFPEVHFFTPQEIYRLGKKFNYRTEREWARLMTAMGYEFVTTDEFSEKLYSDVWSCLLRVLIRICGIDTMRFNMDDEEYYAIVTDTNVLTFWNFASYSMKDGELLHVAVELNCILGVQATAWPGVIRWKNENGKTALDIAMETENSNKEIVRYLQHLEERLDVSFYQHENIGRDLNSRL